MYEITEFHEAKTVREALTLLNQRPDSMVISGGTDVLIKLHERKLKGVSLVSVHALDALKDCSVDESGTLHIGAGLSFHGMERSPVLQGTVPLLCQAAGMVGGPQVRNMGTVGGNLCNGMTSADCAPAMLACNAILALESADGRREVSVHDFYLGPGKTVRRREELLTEILIRPEDYRNCFGHYIKYAMREAMDIATLSCAVLLRAPEAVLEDIRISCGVLAPTPIRLRKTEEALCGKIPDEQTLALAKKAAEGEISPRSSWRASREFRESIAAELLERCVLHAYRASQEGKRTSGR